jgi:hypothetical protein
MAPVIALGSSFLVAGSANATVKAAKNVKPTITVCKSVAGSLHFSINGKLMSLNKECSAVTAKAGVNHVIETWAPASYRNIASISVSPNSARVSTSVRTATATVRLSAHGAATVRFVNAKIVTQVISRTTGRATTGTGYIEVCKYAGDSDVEGNFPFTISSGGETVATVSVAAGSCSSDVAVPAGAVLVTEANEFPYAVTEVTSLPTISVSGITLGAGGSATFAVSANQAVSALFTDGTVLGYFKICKVLADDQGSLAGSKFNYTIGWTFTPPNGATAITGTGSATVVAVDASVAGGACSLPFGAPAGSVVTATENAFPDVAVTNVAIIPAGDNAGSANGTAVFTVPTDGSTASATFTNDPLGTIEVCKNFYSPDDLNYNANNSAQFTVNGGASFWVAGGACSAPISVPAGTATVTEAGETNFFIWNVSTRSATDIFGTRLLTGDTVNPASVTVPYGGVGNETVVTFTNAVDPTQFKICKQESSADANLSGQTFDFSYSFEDTHDYDIGGSGGVSLTIAPVTATNPTGLVCSGLIWGPPAVDPSGYSINVNVTEDSTSIADVAATSITYQGNGWEVYDSTDGGTVPVNVSGDGSAAYCFDPGPGAGISVVTFTNSRTVGDVPS